MESINELLSNDVIFNRLAAMKPTVIAPSSAKPIELTELSNPFINAAAVLVYFDPETIHPFPVGNFPVEHRDNLMNELVGCSILSEGITPNKVAENKSDDKVVLLSLRDDVRKNVLALLLKKGVLSGLLQSNLSDAVYADNTTQRLFTRCLKGDIPDIHGLSLEELTALIPVIIWLKDIEGFEMLPKHGAVLAEIELNEMLLPMRHLTGVYEQGVFRSTFKGRKQELKALRTYVGVAPPQGVMDTITRGINSVTASFYSKAKEPMLVFGVGGIGKSSLLANFILEHFDAFNKDRFPFVYLDFDRPQLNPLEPETLLVEAARQLSIQYSDQESIAKSFLDFYNSWYPVFDFQLGTGSSESINLRSLKDSQKKETDRINIQDSFLKLIKKLEKTTSKPFVIVLDTFEEVQYKGPEYVISLNEFMERLKTTYTRLRVVIAGRSPVTSLEINLLELGDLDKEAAIGFLEKFGISDGVIAANVVNTIGGNPLSLKLAAELVRNFGPNDLKSLRFNRKKYGILTERLPQLEIQGILYHRILNHLHNARLQKLASPGLVLRKITPEIILEVLNEPCNLKVLHLDDAVKLFEEIKKELSLVIPISKNELKHRPDVRKVMLKLIRASTEESVIRGIEDKAIAYYQQKDGLVNRAEEIYHRLASGESPRTVELRWMEGVQHYLLNNLEELPNQAQAFLIGKTGIKFGESEIWETADMEDLNRHIARLAADLLNSGRAQKALELLEEVTPAKGREVLGMLKVRALSQLNRRAEAKDFARQLINSYYSGEYPVAILHELLRIIHEDDDDIENGSYYDAGSVPPAPLGSPEADFSTFSI